MLPVVFLEVVGGQHLLMEKCPGKKNDILVQLVLSILAVT